MVSVKSVLVFAASLLMPATGRADMYRWTGHDLAGSGAVDVVPHPAPELPGDLNWPLCLALADSDPWAIRPLVQTQTDVEQAGGPCPVCILSDEHDSFGLCLYALFTVGLYKAVPKVRAVPVVLSRKHGDAPFLLAHPADFSCGSLRPVMMCSFITACCRDDAALAQRSRTVYIEALRPSQCVLTTRSMRGPPVSSCEWSFAR